MLGGLSLLDLPRMWADTTLLCLPGPRRGRTCHWRGGAGLEEGLAGQSFCPLFMDWSSGARNGLSHLGPDVPLSRLQHGPLACDG